MDRKDCAPGAPGVAPTWTSGAKAGVGTAFGPASRVWFTLNDGILGEVYYPRLDVACTRDMGLCVTDGRGFVSEEQRDTDQRVEYITQGVPAYRLTNTCKRGYYRLVKEIVVDPGRDVLLQRVTFTPLKGTLSDYHVYVLLAPHLGNQGSDNTAWVGAYKGVPMLLARRDRYALALAASAPWLERSAGFVGASDGYQDLRRHKRMTKAYKRAENGNVALTGEIDLRAGNGIFTLALGFGPDPVEAGHHARAGIMGVFADSLAAFSREWKSWQESLLLLDDNAGADPGFYGISACVIHSHEGKEIPGAVIASLSIPWGETRGGPDIGGYHLVWVRDMVEAVSSLLAAGTRDQSLRVIHYIEATQEEDGHWPQNMWPSGEPYWNGIQLDETGLPILLIEKGWRQGLLDSGDMARLWPMIKRAAGYIVRNGPVTQQDRWEENSGYSPYTLAAEIAALLAAADLADIAGERAVGAYLRQTADAWNVDIERWTYATGTEVAQRFGVDGYYVRIAPEDGPCDAPWRGSITIRNRPPGDDAFPATEIVSPDALALVRFGLRRPDDPRILDTIKVVDALTRVETPSGPVWHRYNQDGYGEHEDGSPFDGTGVGRGWPLLTGERAHYELAAGHVDVAERLMHTMAAFASQGGMLPEQVWDTDDIPSRGLFLGRPTGAAMPLVWAHAEYIKLRRSLRTRRVFDTPPQTLLRYLVQGTGSALTTWRFRQQCPEIAAGQVLRIEVLAPARVRWTTDGWRTTRDSNTSDTSLGVHFVDLPTTELRAGRLVQFTFFWPGGRRWEGRDFSVEVS